jgi:tetratricopeptide (TPR) repeat protein
LGDNAGLMPVRLRRLTPAVVIAALLCAGTARAQDKPADPKTAAKEHYNRGTSFYDLGRYDDAAKEFEAAYQLKNDPAFLYNLAQSYRQAGNHERAVHFYKTYLRYVPKAPNRADIEEKIKSEEQLAAKGTGTGTQPPPGTGTTPPPGTGTTPPPGTGTTPPPGTGTEPTVVLPPPNTGMTPPPGTGNAPPIGYPAEVPPADPGRKFRIAGLATGGAGAVMLLVGIVEGFRAKAASDDIEKAAMAGMAFDPEVQKRGQSAEKAEKIFTVLGLIAAAGGVGLYFYGNHVTAAAETTTWRVSLAPVIAPDQGGATLRISF